MQRNTSMSSRRLVFMTLLAIAALASAANGQPAFTKTFTPDTIGPGSTATLQFTIDNSSGGVPATSLDFTDNLPAGVTLADPASATSTCSGGTLSASDGGSSVSYTDGAVGAGGSCTISVNVTSSTPGTHTNTSGDLTSDLGNSGTASDDLTVATDRPGFSKGFSPSTVPFGGRSTLTFTIDNTANGSQALFLAFTDNLPTGMTVASPSNAATTCTGGSLTATSGTSLISYSFATFVAAGSSCTVTVDVIGGSVGVLTNTSDELSTDFLTVSSGKATASLTVTNDRIVLTKTFTDDPVAPGGSVTLELTIANLDRSSSATNIAFTDDLDAALTGLVATTLPTSPCGGSLSGTSVLTFSGGSLSPEASCTFSATLQVPTDAATGGHVNTTSSITADVGGRPVSASAASDTLFVSAAPSLTKTFLSDPVGAGDTVTVEFTITNNSSSSAASDIAFTDNLDAFLSGTIPSTVPAGGFCGAGSSITLTFDPIQVIVAGGNLAASDSCTFTVDLAIPLGTPADTYTNTTSDLTANLDGAAVTAGSASDDLTVVGSPRIIKEFIDDPTAPGDTVTLQFTIINGEENPFAASDIAFTDDLTATLSGLTAVGLPSSGGCGAGSQLTGTTSLSFTGGSLVGGDSCTFTVTLQVPSTALPGNYPNSTSNLMSTVSGVTVINDAATDVLQVSGLSFSKSFTDDPVIPGDTVTLEFTIDNTSPVADVTNMVFTDNLSDVLSGMTASGLPTEPCGAGSSITGTSLLIFSGGNLLAGASCTFSVTVQVPAGTVDIEHNNVTSILFADVGGSIVVVEPARDELVVTSDLLRLTKEFTNDPASPGGTVDLQFTLANQVSRAVSNITFTDDLDAALAGLVSSSGTLLDVCGTGSQVGGTDVLTLSGGSLAADASCTFSVTLTVPNDAPPGGVFTNTTSGVSGTIIGLAVDGDPATDDLKIDALSFSKSFDPSTAEAGDVVTLTFNIQNASATEVIDRISFSDDLDAELSGLAAFGLPEFDVCGEGSELAGTSFLTFTGGVLLPGGSCTFSVDVQVPAEAEPGDYLNVTSELEENAQRAAAPATATLTIIEVTDVDSDGDGVLDAVDVCAGTVIPEGVPTRRLGVNRFALTDDDGIFDTTPPPGNGNNGPGLEFTIEDTAGCSCEQIIEAQGLGQGHVKFGCSISAMQDWIALVNP